MNRTFAKFLMLAALCALLLPMGLLAAEMGQMPAGGQGTMMPGMAGMMMPAAEGQALLNYITKVDPYSKWELMPGTTKMRQGKEPHATFQNVYVNRIAAAAFKAKTGSLPDGAIIVKETFAADKTPSIVSAMYKIRGYNPEAGDIMWLRYAPDMKILAQGKVGPCIGCHTAAKANDYVVLAPLK